MILLAGPGIISAYIFAILQAVFLEIDDKLYIMLYT